MSSRLQDKTSPYLLQHAYNLVDLYPWGEEGLHKAGIKTSRSVSAVHESN
jgi:uncharacterized protein YyaL (SSP411 family)